MDKKELVELLRERRISEQTLGAFKKVKREAFVQEDYRKYSYEDRALPIAHGATISQPSTIAFMLDLLELKPNLSVLEIGSGSGYVLALIDAITSSKVYGVEIIKELARSSQRVLEHNKNIIIINKSGSRGLPEHAPYDRILISASACRVPLYLLNQLKDGGIIVASVRNSIIKLKKNKDRIKKEEFPGFAFVPLQG
ncbi:MAG: protein-L-isoaspartate O-methyltransferase [Nanoarchaeota archaeon]